MKRTLVLFLLITLSTSAFANCGWQWGFDKGLHVGGGAAISIFFSAASWNPDPQWHENRGLLAGFLAGVGKEAYDAATEKETMCSHIADVAVTTGGALIPWGIAKIVKKINKQR